MCQKKIMRKRSNEHLSDEPPKKRISPGGNTLPTQISAGEIFTDLAGKQWRIGKAIGYGGFGEIYLASDNIKEPVKNDAKYVVKVENHSNGPLFVEINCLIRIAKLAMIEEWEEKHGKTPLGMPHYVASGSHTINNEKLRFLVIPRYEQDLEKIFLAKNKKFNLKTTILICIQILDILEYIHSKGYVHCDVKASNILHCYPKPTTEILKTPIMYKNCAPLSPRALLSLRQIRRVNYLNICECSVRWSDFQSIVKRRNLRKTQRVNYEEHDENCFEDYPGFVTHADADVPIEENVTTETENKNQVILIDYGLATKYLQSDGRHKQFCNDERKAHAGTIQFCSIDAHLGASSRRSDLESLGYNMIYWLTSSLPWENDTNNPETIQMKKEQCLNNLNQFLTSCFGNDCPVFIYEYFNYIKSLTFESAPDYNYCRTLLSNALKDYGYKDDGILDFDNLEGWGQKPKKSRKSFENKMIKKTKKLNRLPLTSNIIVEKPKLRKKTRKTKSTKLNWSQIPDPEVILRKKHHEIAKVRERKLTESSDSSCNGNSIQCLDIKSLNPTYAMLDVFYKSKDKNSNCNGIYKVGKKFVELEHREGYTHAMNLVLTKMNQRRLEEIEQETENIVPVKKTKTRSAKTTTTSTSAAATATQKHSTRKLKLATVVTRAKSTRVLRGHGLRG